VTRDEVLRYRLPMRPPTCPMCHASAVSAGKLTYCPHCGWQKKEAEAQLRLNLKIAPIVFALMTMLLLFLFFRGGQKQNSGLIGLFLAFPLIALVVSYAITRRNLRILLAQPPPVTQPQGAAASLIGGGQGAVINPRYEELLHMPAPRDVRLSRRGQFNLFLVLVVVLAFVSILLVQLYRYWAITQSFGAFHFREWGMLGFALLLLLILLAQWRTVARDRELLEKGDIVNARIVQKWGNRSASALKYEYQDGSGVKHVQTGTDYTQKLQEGMCVPVFYDRENPNRQVPVCGTYFEVISKDNAAPQRTA
jgi:hypothetical protein